MPTKYTVVVTYMDDSGPEHLRRYSRGNVDAETYDDAIDQVVRRAKKEHKGKTFMPIKAYAIDVEKALAFSKEEWHRMLSS